MGFLREATRSLLAVSFLSIAFFLVSFPSSLFVFAADVEIKFSVRNGSIAKAIQILGLELKDAKKRKVAYLDSADQILRKNDLILRLRELKEDSSSDVVVKIRPYRPGLLDSDFLKELNAKIEYDRIGSRTLMAVTVRKNYHGEVIKTLLDGKMSLKKILTEDQKDLLRAFLNEDELKWSDLEVLGRAKERSWDDVKIEGFSRPLTVQLWEYPDQYESLEISVKVPEQIALDLRKSCKSRLRKLGIRLKARPELKTDEMYAHSNSTLFR